MGKGQRARELRAQDKVENPQKYIRKKKNDGWITPVIMLVIIVLIVGVFVMNYVNNSGVMLRSQTVMETENYKVTGTMMQFAVMTTYQNFVSQYSDYLSYFGLDTTKKLADQKYGDGTWLDYFRDSTKTSLEELLVYAEGAKAAGLTLTDDEKAAIKTNIDSYSTNAKRSNYTLDAYLTLLYGKGVKTSDINDFLEMTTLAEKYRDQVKDEATDAVTEEDIENYYLTVQSTYSLIDVLAYSEKIDLPADMTDDEKETKKQELRDAFAKIAAGSTAEEFETNLREYLANIDFETEQTDADGNKTTGNSKYTEDEINTMMDTVKHTYKYSEITVSDAASWLYEENDDHVFQRNIGDTKLFEDTADIKDESTDTSTDTSAETGDDSAKAEDATKAQTFTVYAYCVTRTPYRDESATRNVGHILFKADTYGSDEAAYAKAQEVLDEFRAGEQTKDAFETLGNKYTEDSNVFYEDVANGQMTTEFNDWLYDDSRTEGDTDIVKTEYGYHVVYYLGEGQTTWHSECLDSVVNINTTNTFSEMKDKYAVTTSDDALKAIKG